MTHNQPSHPSMMRETLELIRDRFDAAKPRYVLFTTFNFVPQFFEANVLPLLAGDSADDLTDTSETKYAINQELEKLNCVVACDRSASSEPKGGMRYGLLPVGLAYGRFHPKIMLMAGTLAETGKPGMWLSVGSGNLSLSGWAINREVVSAVPVVRQHADELLPLVTWLLEQTHVQLGSRDDTGQEEGAVRIVLRELAGRLADSEQLQPEWRGMPTLHVALPFRERPGLIDALKGDRTWARATVIAPYWSDVTHLVGRLGVSECRFVPSLCDVGYSFPLSTLDGKCTYAFAKFGDDRYTHAKALLLEDGIGAHLLCIGSANFTAAALSEPAKNKLANVEAVLRYEIGTLLPRPWRDLLPLSEDHVADQPAGQEEEQAPPLLPIDVSVYYNWRTGTFGGYVSIDRGIGVRNLVLELAGKTIALGGAEGTRLELPQVKFPCSQPVRTYVLKWSSDTGEQSYRGMVWQINGMDEQLLYLPRPRLDHVLEFLRGLNPAVSEEVLHQSAARGRGEGGGDGEADDNGPVFDFFGLFQGTWNLREYYRQAESDNKPRDPFDSIAQHSLTTLYRAITLQSADSIQEKIGRYVQLAEVRTLFDMFADAGIHPPPGCACNFAAIHEEMGRLLPPIRAALRDSPAFKSMFGSRSERQVEGFLTWFHAEIKQKEAHHAG